MLTTTAGFSIIMVGEIEETERRKTMFTVCAYDDMVVDEVVVFEGTLEECRQYIANDEWSDELYIVAEDGFTVVE